MDYLIVITLQAIIVGFLLAKKPLNITVNHVHKSTTEIRNTTESIPQGPISEPNAIPEDEMKQSFDSVIESINKAMGVTYEDNQEQNER